MKKLIERLLTQESQKTSDCLCGHSTAQTTSATCVALVIIAGGKNVSDFKDEEGKEMLSNDLVDAYVWTHCYKVPNVMQRLTTFLGLQ